MRTLSRIFRLLVVSLILGGFAPICSALDLPEQDDLVGSFSGRAENGLWQLNLDEAPDGERNSFELAWMRDDPTIPTVALVGTWVLSGKRLKLEMEDYGKRKERLTLTLEEHGGKWALRMPHLPAAMSIKELPRERALLTPLTVVTKADRDAQIRIGEFTLSNVGETETTLLRSTANFKGGQGPLTVTLARELTFDHATPETLLTRLAESELGEPMKLVERSGPVQEANGRLVLDRSYQYQIGTEDHVGWNCMVAETAAGGIVFYDFTADIRCDGALPTGWNVLNTVRQALRPVFISSSFDVSGSDADSVALPQMSQPNGQAAIRVGGDRFIPVADTEGQGFSVDQYLAEGQDSDSWTKRLAIWHRTDANDAAVEVRLISRNHAAWRKGRKSEYWEGKGPAGQERYAVSYTEFGAEFCEWSTVVGEAAPNGEGIVLYQLVVRAKGDEDINAALRNLDYGKRMRDEWRVMRDATFGPESGE